MGDFNFRDIDWCADIVLSKNSDANFSVPSVTIYYNNWLKSQRFSPRWNKVTSSKLVQKLERNLVVVTTK